MNLQKSKSAVPAFKSDLDAAREYLPRHPEIPKPKNMTRRLGRPKGNSSDATRQRILDAAEALFAEKGYDGTSIREVAAASRCQIQAVSYHFGQKDRLFDMVIMRRAAVMTEYRRRALAELRVGHTGKPVELAGLVRAYIKPFIESSVSGDPGWRNYAALMGRLANSPLGTEVIHRHYDPMAGKYIAEISRVLPGVPESDVIDGFMFMVAAMLSICADTGRARRLLPQVQHQSSKLSPLERAVRFIVSGFYSFVLSGSARVRKVKSTSWQPNAGAK